MNTGQILGILGTMLSAPKRPPKEDKPKEEPKDEKPEGKRSGGYVKSADGCAVRGKTKGRIV